MKRIFSHPLSALGAGLCLRLFFVLKFPATSGDTALYEEIATNWLKHGSYAMKVAGQITPVDLRMPGYPAFLALIYALTGRTGADARVWVMLSQVAVDLLSCVVIARLAALLATRFQNEASGNRVFTAALWLAATCPFTANYTAVPLTEVFAVLFTAGAFYYLVLQLRRIERPDFRLHGSHINKGKSAEFTGLKAGLLAGAGTLFRPETPLLLIAAAPVLGWLTLRRKEGVRWFQMIFVMGIACLLPLVPWGVRNIFVLDDPQFLAPKNSNLPGELIPYGFMAWEKTWLFRVRDCYLVPWKLNEEPFNVDDIPARAFDSPEEKERAAAILEPYNEDLTLTSDEDAAFGRLARERTARHPLRTYLLLPIARAFAMWFTPRIELLPFSGTVFPLVQSWEDDRVDQTVTIGFFLLNILYAGLAVWGAVRLWRRNFTARPALALMLVYILLRTVFLTTLETPEPRYVLVCFPVVLALAAQFFAQSSKPV